MKVRSIIFNDFRCFRGTVRIDFCGHPLEPPRAISALAGTNGSGKTTILRAIQALLDYALDPKKPAELISEAWESGFIGLEITLPPAELGATGGHGGDRTFLVAVGRSDHCPKEVKDRTDLICRIVQRGTSGKDFVRAAPVSLKKSVGAMLQGESPLLGGLLVFPSNRRISASHGGPIQPPPAMRHWIDVVEDQDSWNGGLEQQWVWENYLDLERGNGRKGLNTYVDLVQQMLGPSRRIRIQEGRVLITPSTPDLPPVRIEHLPSGEKQILNILGELTRRRRKSMVCLIDEPEISLHPALQHAFVYHLRAFARAQDTQFILATHSLEIVSALPGSTIFLDELTSSPSTVERTKVNEAA